MYSKLQGLLCNISKITNATSSKSKVHVGSRAATKTCPKIPHHHASPSVFLISQLPPYPKATMTPITHPTTLFHPGTTTTATTRHHRHPIKQIRATISGQETKYSHTRRLIIATSISLLGLNTLNSRAALAENWGVRSFIKERFFEPGLSPEDAVARIRQTREGLHSIRNMLETMSWRYVLFYIRLKAAYLSQDLKNAMSMVPEAMKSSYVKVANELVDNMAEFDYYVRTPKVYESYLYYEKTLKSIDDLVAVLA